jgi:hypothetical protein
MHKPARRWRLGLGSKTVAQSTMHFIDDRFHGVATLVAGECGQDASPSDNWRSQTKPVADAVGAPRATRSALARG